MEFLEKLKKIKESQKNLLREYEDIVNETEKISAITENEKLKKDLAKNKKEFSEIKKEFNKKIEENEGLRLTLKEQIINEKLNILKISEKKFELYFGRENAKQDDNLKIFIEESKKKIEEMKKNAEKNLGKDKDEILNEINKLTASLNEKMKKERERILDEEKKLFKDFKQGLGQFSDKDIDEKTMEKRIRQSKIEFNFGLNYLNKIGIVLILIAIGVTAKYAQNIIPPLLKGISFFLLGIIFIIGGELFYRKQKEVFSFSMIGGGIAILYSSVFYSYFLLNIIDLNTGLLLSILITLAVIVLSLRYDSKTILSVGLTGGYLPFITYIFTFGFSGNAVYIAMAYLLLLNLLVLFVSFYKSWIIANYISFILNIPSIIYLTGQCPAAIFGIIYSSLVFIIYLLIILAYPLIYKKSLKMQDIILLVLNTFISSFYIYRLIYNTGTRDFGGIYALVFCMIYLLIAFFTNKIMKNEKNAISFFYITSLTFAVLMIPFQFGRNYLSLGWLVEGVLLTVFGYKKNIKLAEIFGWIIFGLCSAIFIIFDLFICKIGEFDKTVFFDLKYFLITAGSVLIFIIYQFDIYKNKLSEFSGKAKFIKAFKYAGVINAYIFLIYIAVTYYNRWLMSEKFLPDYFFYNFYKLVLISIITLSYGFLLKKLKIIYDKVINVFSIILNILACIFCLIMLAMPVINTAYDYSKYLKIATFLVLIIYNIVVLFTIKDLVLRFIRELNYSLEYLPLALGIILMGNVTLILIRQFNFQYISLIITFSYLSLSLVNIIYGFWKRYIYIRIFGLALIIFALAKLFIYDLGFLETLGKIIAYFSFGFILILISYIYQLANKKFNIRNKNVSGKK